VRSQPSLMWATRHVRDMWLAMEGMREVGMYWSHRCEFWVAAGGNSQAVEGGTFRSPLLSLAQRGARDPGRERAAARASASGVCTGVCVWGGPGPGTWACMGARRMLTRQ